MDRIRCDGLTRNQGKADALGEGSEQEMALHHGEVHADADARASAEWQVGVTGKLFLPFKGKTFGVKFLRFREEFLSTVQGVRSDQNDPAFGYQISIDLDIAQRAP